MAASNIVSISLLLIAAVLKIDLGASLEWQFFGVPDGCANKTTPDCTYTCSWSLDPLTDLVAFTISSKQASGRWTGVAFGPTELMETQDVKYGYVDAGGVGHVVDAYVGVQHSRPVIDSINEMTETSITYENGEYTMKFKMPRVSSDSNDVPLTNVYFKYPDSGGPMNGDIMQRHTTTPIVAASTVTVSADSASSMAAGGSTEPSMAHSGESETSMAHSMEEGASTMASMAHSGESEASMAHSMEEGASTMASMAHSGESEASMAHSMEEGASTMASMAHSGEPGSSTMAGGSQGPSGGSEGSTSSGGGESSGGSSSGTVKAVLLATLLTFGGLLVVTLLCFCFFTRPAPGSRGYGQV